MSAAVAPPSSIIDTAGFVQTRQAGLASIDTLVPTTSFSTHLPSQSNIMENFVSSGPSELAAPSQQSRSEPSLGAACDRQGSNDGRSDETHASNDLSPIASSSLASTPRAATPSPCQQNTDLHNTTPTTERSNGKARAIDSVVLTSMTGLALQVQSAVSRNVTSPLVQVLSDAEQQNELKGLPTCGNGGDQISLLPPSAHSSSNSSYRSANASPSLDALSQELPAKDDSETNEEISSSQTFTSARSVPIEKHDSSSGTESTTTTQSDISRTPSTSTTASSHASSLDTAISSTISSDELEVAKILFNDNKAPSALQISLASHAIVPPGQGSPASVASNSNVVLLPSALESGSNDPASADARLTIAKVRRFAALLELVDTERNYADDLATLVLVFLDNLCMMPFFNDPARQSLVTRNAKDLLRTHQKLSAKLEGILIELELRSPGNLVLTDDGATDLQKALSPQADEAVVRVAKLFHQMMPSLECYKGFCSRHGEALALIREAERRATEWDAYEKHCSEIMKLTLASKSRGSSRPVSGSTTPNYTVGQPVPLSSIAASTSPTKGASSLSSSPAAPAQATTRHPSSRLLLRDFLIKPIQRLCLYPLVLQTLQKHSLATGAAADELSLAISLMREVADQVDEAGRRRESELRADLILSRVELSQGITLPFIRSLGDCQMSGTLDVLHHHSGLAPLTAPLHFKYLGIFLYHGFVLMVKVRKNAVYECRHWFPLWAARLSNVEEDSNLIPHSFRLSVQDHHFELAASNVRERQLWVEALSTAISQAAVTPPGAISAYPSSLFLGDPADLGLQEQADEATSASTETQSYFEHNKSATIDPLMAFLAVHAAGSVPAATQPMQRGSRPQSTSWMPTEILLKHASPNSRSIVDRGMVLSEAVITARIAKDNGAMSTLYAASGSSIGSAVGSSLGLNRLSARETSTVKIQRRGSCSGLADNADEDEDANNLVFTATLIQPGIRSRTSSRGNVEATSDRENWRASFMRKAGRGKSSNTIANQPLTCNTSELSPPTWLIGSSSTPTSPTTISRLDLPLFDSAMNNSTGLSSGPEDSAYSVPTSPAMGHHSAGSSTVNLRALTAMPARTRMSTYGARDSLTASFGQRGRTRSAQADVPSYNLEAGGPSGMSSLGPSPMTSTVNLPQGESISWPSSEEPSSPQKQTRSRANSISSVTGSIRRVLTNGALRHKKSQSEIGRVLGMTAQQERQMPTLGLGPMVAEPSSVSGASSPSESCNGHAAATNSPTTNETSQSPVTRTLRRSKTMLSYPRSWFRASTPPSTSIDKINAEAAATATQLRGQRSFVRTSAGSNVETTNERPLRGHTISEPSVNTNRRSSETLLSTIREQNSNSTTASPERRGSKMLHSLKFLQSNRFSPMPSSDATSTSQSGSSSPSSSKASRRLSGKWA